MRAFESHQAGMAKKKKKPAPPGMKECPKCQGRGDPFWHLLAVGWYKCNHCEGRGWINPREKK